MTTFLGEAAEVVAPYEGSFGLSGFADLAEAVLAVIRRVETLGRFAPGEVQAVCGLSQSDRGLRAAARSGIVSTEGKRFGSTPLEPSATVGGRNRRIWPV